MRTYDNGNGFTVSFSERDADEFAERWPRSTVEGRGSFSFKNSGDLVDGSTTSSGDGADWAAFSRDCQRWGEKHIGALRRRHETEKNREWNELRLITRLNGSVGDYDGE